MQYLKGAIAYRLRERIPYEELRSRLKPFASCTAQQARSTGWVPPLEGSKYLVQSVGANEEDMHVICLLTEEKILPAASIAKLVLDEVVKLGRKVTKKDVGEIKDRIIGELLPKALVKQNKVYGVIDNARRLLIVGTSSENKAGDFTARLRFELDELPTHWLRVEWYPPKQMACWITDYNSSDGNILPAYLTLEKHLATRGPDKGAARFKEIDFDTETIQEVLAAGAEVKEIGLTYDDNLTFVLTEDLTLKSIKFLDFIKDAVETVNEDVLDYAAAQLFMEFSTVADVVVAMLDWFGGEVTDDIPVDEDEI
jgi:recombination associated protein RdgC